MRNDKWMLWWLRWSRRRSPLRRVCPECNRYEFYAMTDGEWICEGCGHVWATFKRMTS